MTSERHVFDVVVIGAGVVGCAIARELSKSSLSVLLLERSTDVGSGTSKANTAILHTGFDTAPGSLESKLVARGYELLGEYSDLAGIAVERTGALLVAWDDEQEAALVKLQQKAQENGVLDASILNAAEVRRREPNLGAGSRSALEVPGESIIDPWSVTLAFCTEAIRNGITLVRCTKVTSIESSLDSHVVTTTDGTYRVRWVINAAGLASDVIDRMFDHEDFAITPRRGQLIVFDKLAREKLTGILLPVPTERTKGVLVSPTIWGNVLLGPTAEDLSDREDTRSTEEGIQQLLNAGKKILPDLVCHEVTATYAGLRAASEHRDYQIRKYSDQRYICVGGIRSTGLTSSLAIAEHVCTMLRKEGVLSEQSIRSSSVPHMPPLGQLQKRPLENAELIQSDSQYGRVLCHCEQVSRGEVRDACRSDVPALDIEGARRRTRAMNGRCQGFYCGAEVVEMISMETKIPIAFLTQVGA